MSRDSPGGRRVPVVPLSPALRGLRDRVAGTAAGVRALVSETAPLRGRGGAQASWPHHRCDGWFCHHTPWPVLKTV